MVKVIDNLLPNLYLNKLKYLLSGNTDEDINNKSKFNWFWNDFTSSDGKGTALDNNFMFTHVIWNMNTDNKSPYFETFCPLVYFIAQHIPVKDVIRIKLNLYTNQNKKIIHAKHTDITDKDTDKPLKSCGSYMFEKNGYKLFSKVEGSLEAINGLPFTHLSKKLEQYV